jgi:hypothetical protein
MSKTVYICNWLLVFKLNCGLGAVFMGQSVFMVGAPWVGQMATSVWVSLDDLFPDGPAGGETGLQARWS